MNWVSTTTQAMTWMEAGRTLYAFADASDAAKVRTTLEGQGQHPAADL
jgi:hypothetical protein